MSKDNKMLLCVCMGIGIITISLVHPRQSENKKVYIENCIQIAGVMTSAVISTTASTPIMEFNKTKKMEFSRIAALDIPEDIWNV